MLRTRVRSPLYPASMIAGIQGVLRSIQTDRVLVEPLPGWQIEVLVPGYAIGRLGTAIGQNVSFSTLTYLESQNQGNSFVPRLVGFLTAQDKAFFELLITVKGIGNRKALRAMALPCHQLAHAIADRDAKTLQALPEIGKRSAETIILDLKNKMEPFLQPSTRASDSVPAVRVPTAGASPQAAALDSEKPGVDTAGNAGVAMIQEAVQTLVALGENRLQALEWTEQAMQEAPIPADSGALVAAAFRKKAGA